MNIPGFGAEAALYRTSGHYYVTRSVDQLSGVMLPQFIIPPEAICGPCFREKTTGGCIKHCVDCQPGPRFQPCQVFTVRCPLSQC